MADALTLDLIRLFVALVAVAAVVGIVVRRVAIPYTVTLVVIGLVAADLSPAQLAITPELVLLVLLPGLVFEASLGLDLAELRRTFGGVALLAVPGVVVTAVIVAVVLQAATGLDPALGLVVGAMVAATDPVAVIATFRQLGSPPQLRTVVEGESLLNDGTALVVFAIALRAIGTTVSPVDEAVAFVTAIVVSTAIGVVGGWAASRLMSFVDDHPIELSLSLAAAYGTYLVADALHQSGVIATLVAGIVIGSYGRRVGMGERTREALDTVWEFIAFLLTAFAFLLVGLAISLPQLVGAVPAIAWGVLAILVGRAIVVYAMLGGASFTLARARGTRPLPTGWLHVLFWAGLRGAVAVAMALSLPPGLPQRALLQEIAFGIVLFTLFVQGTTAELVVRRASPARDVEAVGLED
jgi:CPA1 family monovalent cation:H+ antiporter